MAQAIDIANYTHVPTQDELQCAKAQGYDTLIVGVSYGNVGSMQLKAGMDAGLQLEAYSWLRHPFVLHEAEMIRAYNQIADLPVQRMWIDVEDVPTASPARSWQQVNDVWQAIMWWKRNRPDLPLGIYTAKWWWQYYMPGVYEDFDLPLWVAYYPAGAPDVVDLEAYLPGGWSLDDTLMWQYRGTIQTCGINTDRNIILHREEERMKYNDQLLDAVFLEYFKALGRQGAEIKALGEGLASVAQTVAELQTFSGDVPTTIADKLNRMLERTDAVEASLKKFAEDSIKAYEVLHGGNP